MHRCHHMAWHENWFKRHECLSGCHETVIESQMKTISKLQMWLFLTSKTIITNPRESAIPDQQTDIENQWHLRSSSLLHMFFIGFRPQWLWSEVVVLWFIDNGWISWRTPWSRSTKRVQHCAISITWQMVQQPTESRSNRSLGHERQSFQLPGVSSHRWY